MFLRWLVQYRHIRCFWNKLLDLFRDELVFWSQIPLWSCVVWAYSALSFSGTYCNLILAHLSYRFDVARRLSTFLSKRLLLWNRLFDFYHTSQEWSQGCPQPILFTLLQLVEWVGHGINQYVFLNAFFKNMLVQNYNAQSSHIWYITSYRGSLPKLIKLCPCGHNWPRPGVIIWHWII